MKSALLLSALIIFAAYLYSTLKSKYEASKYLFYDISYSPFTIKASGKPVNNEGEHGGKVHFEHVTYIVFHNGKPVDFPNTENNTKRSTSLEMVMTLSGTPVPTLLVAGQAYYLLYLENGVPVVEQTLLARGYSNQESAQIPSATHAGAEASASCRVFLSAVPTTAKQIFLPSTLA